MKRIVLATVLVLATFISCSKEEKFEISETYWEYAGGWQANITIYDNTATLHANMESVQYDITRDYSEISFTACESGKADLLGILNTSTSLDLYDLSYTPKKWLGTFVQIVYLNFY